MIRITLTAAAALLLTASTSLAAELLVDFNRTDDGGPFNQAGYNGLNEIGSAESGDNAADDATTDGTIEDNGINEIRTYTSDVAHTGSQVTVEVSRLTGSDVFLNFRNRTALTGDFAGQSNLLLDNLSTNNLRITLSNLHPGLYRMTTYHHDSQFDNLSDSFRVRLNDPDAPAGFVYLTSNLATSSGTAPETITAPTFQFYADGTTPVELELRNFDSASLVAINGFDLELIPEPGSMGLMIGGLGLLAWRRLK